MWKRESTHAFCLDPSASKDATSICAEGYTDIMCMDCSPNYYATGGLCKRCHNATVFHRGAMIILVSIIVLIAVVGIRLWMRSNTHRQKGPSPWRTVREQLKEQAPLLLQLCDLVATLSHQKFFWKLIVDCFLLTSLVFPRDLGLKSLQFLFCSQVCGGQLWAVLAVLEGNESAKEAARKITGVANSREVSSFWEVPYVQASQLSTYTSSLRFQCQFAAWSYHLSHTRE